MVLAAPAPFAQTTPQPPTAPQPQTQTAPQTQAKTSLAQVVRAAEERSGGRARKVEMESDKGVEVYEIKTVSKDKSTKVMIDPVTGNIVRVDGPGFLSSVFDGDDQKEDRADLARLEASPLTLASAIEIAEKEGGGRAIEAAMMSQYGSTLFEVRVVKDWTLHKVWVDPSTSKVIPIPQEHDDD
jgi:uncharacterized membrane protein YkoI